MKMHLMINTTADVVVSAMATSAATTIFQPTDFYKVFAAYDSFLKFHVNVSYDLSVY